MAKRRRTRTAHPGVKIIRRDLPSGETYWHARWADPDTGKTIQTSLDALGLTTAEARRDWAIRKAKSLVKRKADLAAGEEPRGAPMGIREAIEDYLTRAGDRLEPVTVYGYRLSLVPFADWCDSNGARTLDDLTPARLAGYRDFLARRRKRAPTPKGRRGERRPSPAPRSPASVNHDLQALVSFLIEARRFGRLPSIDREKIAETLIRARARRARPAFIRPPEVRALLAACIRHDRDTFTLTRAEKSGLAPEGSTPRHDPIAPFVLYVLLSGCRAGEARALAWAMVYANDPAPEIILPSGAVKTREERSIDLAVSPALVSLLGALRVRSGGAPFVFAGTAHLSIEAADKARARLVKDYGAPPFTWQRLRQTCATVLNCAPGIYGGAAAFMASKRLGHSVTIAEARYAGLLRDLPRDARTIEAALGIEDLAREVVATAGGLAERAAAEA